MKNTTFAKHTVSRKRGNDAYFQIYTMKDVLLIYRVMSRMFGFLR
jgi:hypothetical protein